MATTAKKTGGGEAKKPAPETGKDGGAAPSGGEGANAGAGEETVTLTRADLEREMSQMRKEIREEFEGARADQMREEIRKEMAAALPAEIREAVDSAITEGSRRRQLDPREQSRKEQQEAQAIQLARLSADDLDKRPEIGGKVCARVEPLARFHVSAQDIAGNAGSSEASSVKIYPDSGPIWLHPSVARSLARSGKVRILDDEGAADDDAA